MKTAKTALIAIASLALMLSAAFGMSHISAEKGKKLFEDPNFAGGDRPCTTCHPGGAKLEDAAEKDVYHVMDGTQQTLEEAINLCIEYANHGKPIPVDSPEMQSLVKYIESL